MTAALNPRSNDSSIDTRPASSSRSSSRSAIRRSISSMVPAFVSPTATAFRSSVDVPRPPAERNVARGCDGLPAAASLLVAASLLLITGCGGSDDPAEASPWADYCAAWHDAGLDDPADAVLDGDTTAIDTLRTSADVGELAPTTSTREAWAALADGADDNATLLAVINPAVTNCREG